MGLPVNQDGAHFLPDQPQEVVAELEDPEKPLTWPPGCLQPGLAYFSSRIPGPSVITPAHWPPQGSPNPSETHRTFTSEHLPIGFEVAPHFLAILYDKRQSPDPVSPQLNRT